MYLSAIKLYETVNLLEVEQGKITITPETTPNMSTFEPINLLQNLQNRSCGGTEQSGMLSAKNPLTFLDQDTCFRSSIQQIRDNSYKFTLGLKFEEPQFIHAVLILQDNYSYAQDALINIDQTELLQNYSIYIGNDSDYTKNQLCEGSPFLNYDDPSSYVFSDRAYRFGDLYG